MSNEIKQTISLYSDSFWKNIFSYIRFWDAPYVELEQIIPKKGKVIDLGCGEGIFANFLAISSSKRQIYGVELDKNRVKHANKKIKNTKFINGDITKESIPKADAIILIHVLHHLNSLDEQEELLKKCIKKLSKNGSLVIAEIEPNGSLKYFTTWFTDHFLVPWLFEKRFYSEIYFRKAKEWKSLLKKLGYKSQIVLADQGKPFSHVILVSKKISK